MQSPTRPLWGWNDMSLAPRTGPAGLEAPQVSLAAVGIGFVCTIRTFSQVPLRKVFPVHINDSRIIRGSQRCG